MERRNITFNAKITPIAPLNDEFTLAKCFVLATGTNRNGSFISEEAVNNALPTLYNTPVIAHLLVDEDGNYTVGGHDRVLEKNKDGGYVFRSLCVPFGVVPERPDEISYEEVEEPDGRGKHTYLTAPVILWTGRFPELKEAFIKDDVYFGQSMEINVNEHAPYEEDKNYTNIIDFSFSALCLLGESVEPCFPNARVEPYEFSLDEKFSELMSQLKEELASCFDNAGKGGETMNENNTVVVTEMTATEEVVEPQTVDCAVSTDIDAPATEPETSFDGNTVTEVTEQPEAQTFASTYRERCEAIHEALPVVDECDDQGRTIHFVRYYVCDFDDAFAYVERSEYHIEKPYEETKGRFAYTFDEETKKASITGEFEEMFVKWITKEENSQIEAMRAEYEMLVTYKADRENADREASFDAVVGEFEDLSGNEDFEAVSANRYSYESAEALRDACYIVRGKNSAPVAKTKTATEPSIPVGVAVNNNKTLMERFHERYSKK